MNVAYQPESWASLYLAVASAAAALAGLLFVALSLNLTKILNKPAHRERARQTMGGFVSLLVLAILILIPGQDARLLGSELVVASLIAAGIVLPLERRALLARAPGQRLGRLLGMSVLNLGWLFGIVCGIGLFTGRLGGLYWLIPTVLIYLLWNLNNAWVLLVQAAQEA
jgi:modulator of FtsH protease